MTAYNNDTERAWYKTERFDEDGSADPSSRDPENFRDARENVENLTDELYIGSPDSYGVRPNKARTLMVRAKFGF